MFAIPDDHYEDEDEVARKTAIVHQDCLQNLGDNVNISLELREKLCKIINGISSDDNGSDCIDDLMSIWYNDAHLISEIYNILRQRGLHITHAIHLSANAMNPELAAVLSPTSNLIRSANDLGVQYSYYVLNGTTASYFNPENFKLTELDNYILNDDEKLFAIPFGFSGDYVEGDHANMLIFKKHKGSKIIECEHFEPYGKSFGRSKEKADFVINRVFEIVHLLFDPKEYKIIMLNPDTICPLESIALQGLVHSEWAGSCAIFSLWYVFLRLLNPLRGRTDTFHLMNDFLKSASDPNDIIRQIVSTFVSLLNINLSDFMVSESTPFTHEKRAEILQQRRHRSRVLGGRAEKLMHKKGFRTKKIRCRKKHKSKRIKIIKFKRSKKIHF